MSIECDIHFNTSFRNTLLGDIPTFLSEGFCELYGASPLQISLHKLVGENVQIVNGNEIISKDAYGQQLKMYSLVEIHNLIEKEYSNFLKENNKSSLTVCLGILKAILENSSQSPSELKVVLYFR